MSLISVAIAGTEPPAIQKLRFGDEPFVTFFDTRPATLLATCADGVTLAVWRLPIGELLHAIRTGQLLEDAAGMRALSDWCYVAIQGAYSCSTDGRVLHNGMITGWTWAALQGALLSVQELGVSIAHVADDAAYERLVISLAGRPRPTRRLLPPKDALFYTPGEAVLLSLPNVGSTKLATLLTACNTPAEALVALCDTGPTVLPGIGPTTRQQARDALGLAEGAILTIIKDDAHETVKHHGADRQPARAAEPAALAV